MQMQESRVPGAVAQRGKALVMARDQMGVRRTALTLTRVNQDPFAAAVLCGVYVDDAGKVPLLECVKQAERELLDRGAPHNYLPIDGIAAYICSNIMSTCPPSTSVIAGAAPRYGIAFRSIL